MCREGRLCEERLRPQSPLEKSDIAEESRAIVGVLRAVEEALRHCVRTHAKGLQRSRASRPKHLWERHRENVETTPALALSYDQYEIRDEEVQVEYEGSATTHIASTLQRINAST